LKEGSRNGTSVFAGALLGELEGGLFTGVPEGYVKEGSGDGHLSPWGAPTGEPGRGSFIRDLKCRRRYCPVWEPGGGGIHLLGTLIVGGLWKQSISFYGSPIRGTLRGGSFSGDPE